MQSKVIATLIIVCISIVLFCSVFLMEKHEVQTWTGASENAKRNPYLASEKFLEGRGIEVLKTVDLLDFALIPTDQTILLTQVDGMLVSQRQINDALDWISRGGYMIVGVSEKIQGNASILKHFDIVPEEVDVQFDDALLDDKGEPMSASEQMREINRKLDEVEPSDEDTPDDTRRIVDSDDAFNDQLFDLLNTEYQHQYYKMDINGGNELTIAVLDRIILNHDLINNYSEDNSLKRNGYTLNTWSRDEHGERLLHFHYGEGSFVALSSTELWENDYIGLADHAYFLSYLVPDDSTLQLFYNLNVPSLFSLIMRYFVEFIWASILLLLLWLWFHGVRVQLTSPMSDKGRRSFAEHLRASADFLSRNEQFSTLLEALQEDIETQFKGHYPNFSHLNDATKAAILVDKTQLPQATIDDWLAFCKNIESREQLFSALQLGNAIRKQL